MTAVSETQFWVLGTEGSCTGCTARLAHTIDGGRTFNAVSAPPTPYANYYQSPGQESISAVRFADGVDGWAFGPGLWATHDDGMHWRTINVHGAVVDLEPGAGGWVYASINECTPGAPAACRVRLIRSSASGDVWSDVLTITGVQAPPPALGVHGTSVWFMDAANLWRSSNAGLSFEKHVSPCAADLGGNLDPVTTEVIWAFCPTGNAGAPALSTNSGVTFAATGGGFFSNGGMVAGLSSRSAFVTGSGDGGLVHTDDGGATYRSVTLTPGELAGWAAFTDATVGYVLVETADGMHSQLWRTQDAGASWAPVVVRV